MQLNIVHTESSDGHLKRSEVDLSLDVVTSASSIVNAILAGMRFDRYDLERIYHESNGLSLAASGVETVPRYRHYALDVKERVAREYVERGDGETDWVPGAEITGEDLLSLVNRHGGTALVSIDQASGLIDEVHACFSSEYSYDEMSEVLDSLQATGTPRSIVGDLAQTSIVTGTGQEQVLGLGEWSISWKRKTVEATNTDNALYETNLGSTKSWTAKAKYMFIIGDTSQSDAILSAVSTFALNALVWNFFPDVATGDPAFQGAAIIDGIDISAGNGKIVGLDVSLKGTGPLTLMTQVAPVANPNTITGQQAKV